MKEAPIVLSINSSKRLFIILKQILLLPTAVSPKNTVLNFGSSTVEKKFVTLKIIMSECF